jgi:hypothetical protein
MALDRGFGLSATRLLGRLGLKPNAALRPDSAGPTTSCPRDAHGLT